MTRRNSLWVAAIAAAIVLPAGAQQPSGRKTSGLPISVIFSASQEGAGSLRTIVHDKAELETYWAKIWSHAVAKDRPAVPAIDFAKGSVILVSLGDQPASNAGIRVTKVLAADGYLDVSVEIIRQHARCIAPLMVSDPSQIVQVPVTATTAVFHDTHRAIGC